MQIREYIKHIIYSARNSIGPIVGFILWFVGVSSTGFCYSYFDDVNKYLAVNLTGKTSVWDIVNENSNSKQKSGYANKKVAQSNKKQTAQYKDSNKNNNGDSSKNNNSNLQILKKQEEKNSNNITAKIKTNTPNDDIKQSGKSTGYLLPRFANLKANEVNVRAGPGSQYYIKHIYRCRTYPVQIIDEFDNWRLIRDTGDNQGWVHENLLSSKQYAMVVYQHLFGIKGQHLNDHQENGGMEKPKPDQLIPVFRLPNEQSRIVAMLEIGVIVIPKKCINEWCKISGQSISNVWIKKEKLWGGLNKHT